MTTTKTSAPSVEDIAGHLKPIDAKVLRVLVQHMAPGQATVRLLNDQLAKAVSRTPRTVQSSINRLSKAGLIARECKASKGKSHADRDRGRLAVYLRGGIALYSA
jgi:predicted transcriptional regulator